MPPRTDVTITKHHGKRAKTYGFRFWEHGELFEEAGFTTEGLARLAGQRLRRKVQEQAFEARWGPIKPKLIRWTEAVEKYKAAKAGKDTLAWDKKRLAWWGEFLATQGVHYVQGISPDDIDAGKAALYERGLHDGGVRQYLAALRQLLRLAVRRWHWLRENPMEVVELPKPSQAEEEKRLPTEDEQDRLLEAARVWPPAMPVPPGATRRPKRGAQCAPGVMGAMILTAMYTGMRKNAVLQLQAEHLRMRPGEIRCWNEKRDRVYYLPLVPTLEQALRSLGVKSGPLFRLASGEPLRRFPERAWQKIRAKAELGWVRFHDLRHLALTLLAEEGVPLHIIKAFADHADIKVTERYLHARRGPMDEAARKLERRYQRGAPRSPERSSDAPSG
ncbi:MAG: tyrosine-type recombinase/integrase [Candidatus Rokubacteria bacterium]|nr:tyrosine-type recombinase/integrase [Candidatus Rokubacteria bacterium]